MNTDIQQRTRFLRHGLLLLTLLLLGGGVAWWVTRVPRLEVANASQPDYLIVSPSSYPLIDRGNLYNATVNWLDARGQLQEVKAEYGGEVLRPSPRGTMAVSAFFLGPEKARVLVFRRDGGVTEFIPPIPFTWWEAQVNDAGYVWDWHHFFTPAGTPLSDPALAGFSPAPTACADPGLLPCEAASPQRQFGLYDPARRRFALCIPVAGAMPEAVFTAGERILTVPPEQGDACVYERGRLLARLPAPAKWQFGMDGTVWHHHAGKTHLLHWRRDTPRMEAFSVTGDRVAAWGDGAFLAATSTTVQSGRLVALAAPVLRRIHPGWQLPYGYRRVALYRRDKEHGRFLLPMDIEKITECADIRMAPFATFALETYTDHELAFSADGSYLAWYHQEGTEAPLYTFKVGK